LIKADQHLWLPNISINSGASNCPHVCQSVLYT